MATDHLDPIFIALADPNRRSILTHLAKGETSVNELAESLPMDVPTLDSHLDVLEAAGLVGRDREGPQQPYRLQVKPLEETTEWMQRWQERIAQGEFLTHIIEAPRKRVFRAWTDPAEVPEWCCRDGLFMTQEDVCIDLRVGGRYELTMHYPGVGLGSQEIGYEIIEWAQNELIVLRHDPMPKPAKQEPLIIRVEFDDLEGKTRLRLSDGDGLCPYLDGFHSRASWNSALDRLAALVAG